jgi:hypothetical protein
MTMLQKFYQSQLYIEYSKNRRLQWMCVGICIILTLSIIKFYADQQLENRQQTQQQLALLAKYKLTAQSKIDQAISVAIDAANVSWLEALPAAQSASVAEAQALAEVEQKIGKLLSRKRLNLLGSEPLAGVKPILWQVRVEIAGQLAELDLIELLQYFDNQNKHARIASFQFSPKTSNSINLVVDLLYKRANDAE